MESGHSPGGCHPLLYRSLPEYYGQPEYSSHQPGLTRAATEYILDRGAISFGVDNTSPDMFLDKTYPCHMVCRERKITHYENLCNLDKLVGKRFTFIALPLKIRKGTGSRCARWPSWTSDSIFHL